MTDNLRLVLAYVVIALIGTVPLLLAVYEFARYAVGY